jgi:hypothetical protein
MEMRATILTEEEMKRRQTPYQVFVYSQDGLALHWKAFQTYSEFYHWLIKTYKGRVIEKQKDYVTFEIPYIYSTGVVDKFYQQIENLTDVDDLNLWEKIYQIGSREKYHLRYECQYQLEEGTTLFNGRETPCKRFFFYEEGNNTPSYCLKVICRYKRVSEDGRMILAYQ